MASAPLLPSSPSPSRIKYDVFLSFRDTDVRNGFVSELLHQLTETGIETFKDDTNLQVEDDIYPTLLAAIQESRFAIVILSPNYASSPWCLRGLADIFEHENDNYQVLPLFLNVEPRDVLHLKGGFGEAFTNYENSGRYSSEELAGWKNALKKAANCYGLISNAFKTEIELINKIVEVMYRKVQSIEKNKAPGAVVVNRIYIFGGNINLIYIFGGNINLGNQRDFINVHGDFIERVDGNFNKGGPSN